MTKTICKCKKCGASYILWQWEHFISKFTFTWRFRIEDKNDPSKNKVGIAVNHC